MLHFHPAFCIQHFNSISQGKPLIFPLEEDIKDITSYPLLNLAVQGSLWWHLTRALVEHTRTHLAI